MADETCPFCDKDPLVIKYTYANAVFYRCPDSSCPGHACMATQQQWNSRKVRSAYIKTPEETEEVRHALFKILSRAIGEACVLDTEKYARIALAHIEQQFQFKPRQDVHAR